MARNSFLSLMFEYFGAYGDDGDYNEYKDVCKGKMGKIDDETKVK